MSLINGSQQRKSRKIVKRKLAKQNGKCFWCFRELETDPKKGNTRGYCTVEHIIPTSLGGPNDRTNIVAACAKCNVRRADRFASLTQIFTGTIKTQGWNYL